MQVLCSFFNTFYVPFPFVQNSGFKIPNYGIRIIS